MDENDIPEIKMNRKITILQPSEPKQVIEGFGFYEGYDLWKLPSDWMIGDPVPESCKVPITNREDLHAGDFVTDQHGMIGFVNNNLDRVTYNEYYHSSISFNKDDRHCWTSDMLFGIDPSAVEMTQEIIDNLHKNIKEGTTE